MHAHAADPLQAYRELFKAAPLPPLMRQGIMEPAILKHYLLLHDDAAVPGGLARSAFHFHHKLLVTRHQVLAECIPSQSTASRLVPTTRACKSTSRAQAHAQYWKVILFTFVD